MIKKEFDRELFRTRLNEVTKNKPNNQLAKELGVDASTISKWYKTKVGKGSTKGSIPKADDLLTIASLYHCSVDYLLGNEPSHRDVGAKQLCEYLVTLHNNLHLDMRCKEKFNFNDSSAEGALLITVTCDILARIPPFPDSDPKMNRKTLDVVSFIQDYLKIESTALAAEAKESYIKSLLDNVDAAWTSWEADYKAPESTPGGEFEKNLPSQ